VTQPTASASFLDDLSQQVPGASTDAGERARCAKDWSWPALYAEREGNPTLPDVVVRATSDEEVAATLKLATANGVPVVPRGGGSGVMGAAVPYAGGIVVDVSGMDEIVAIDEVSLTATVPAGMNGRECERRLNEGCPFRTSPPRPSGRASAATSPRAARACFRRGTGRSRTRSSRCAW
jgi:FAD/FMN-containing dehydrogenase